MLNQNNQPEQEQTTISKVNAAFLIRKEVQTAKTFSYFVLSFSIILMFSTLISAIFSLVVAIILLVVSAFSLKNTRLKVIYLEEKYKLDELFDIITYFQRMRSANGTRNKKEQRKRESI